MSKLQLITKNTNNLRKIVLVALVALMMIFSWLKPIDTLADGMVDAGLKRALISYGTARAMNAAISFAQGTVIAAQPMGIGVNLAFGELLDPINDLVEQFSQLLLIASIAFGIQKMLIAIGGDLAVSMSITAVTCIWCLLFLTARRPPSWLSKLMLILFVIRFAIPVSVVGSDLVFKQYLSQDYQSSQSIVENASKDIVQINEPINSSTIDDESTHKKPGIFGRFFGKKDSETPNAETTASPQAKTEEPSIFEKLNPKKKIHNLMLTAEKGIEHIIRLMVVFVLNTIVIPIFLILALFWLARSSMLSLDESHSWISRKAGS